MYEFVEDLYCKDNGRLSINPVVLFRIVLIQHIYGIRSLRRTLEEISMNMAYRWFIGYPLNEQVPHFSTVSYNFKHRFNTASVEYIFRWVLKVAADEGYFDTEAIFVDGTHIKASANLKKQARKAVPKEAKRYAHELFDEINKDREAHGKKPFDENSNGDDSGSRDNSSEPEMVEKTVGNAMIEWLNTYIKPCDKASTYTSYFYCIQTILIFKPEYQTKFLDDLCEEDLQNTINNIGQSELSN